MIKKINTKKCNQLSVKSYKTLIIATLRIHPFYKRLLLF